MKDGIIYLFLAMVFSSSSCTNELQSHEMKYVMDPSMSMDGDASSLYQNYIYSIREGSVPTIVIKGNGGCGCN